MPDRKRKNISGVTESERTQSLGMLRRVALFDSLTDQELQQVTARMQIKRYKKNSIVFYEDETNEFMYMILSGRVKVVQFTENGKEIVLALHRAGDFFGEMSLIDHRTTPAMVMATEDAILAIADRSAFQQLLQTQGKLVDVMLRILCGRLRASWERIQILSFSSAVQRIRMLLHVLSDEHGQKTSSGTVLNVKLTHQQIAGMTGIARETVTRILDKLAKDGELTILKNKVLVLSDRFDAHSLLC